MFQFNQDVLTPQRDVNVGRGITDPCCWKLKNV